MIVGEANGCADGEEPSHVVDEGGACLDEQEADSVGRASSLSTRNAHNSRGERIANAHEDASDGKRRDGKHQRFAELLEILHHSVSLLPFICTAFQTIRTRPADSSVGPPRANQKRKRTGAVGVPLSLQLRILSYHKIIKLPVSVPERYLFISRVVIVWLHSIRAILGCELPFVHMFTCFFVVVRKCSRIILEQPPTNRPSFRHSAPLDISSWGREKKPAKGTVPFAGQRVSS